MTVIDSSPVATVRERPEPPHNADDLLLDIRTLTARI